MSFMSLYIVVAGCDTLPLLRTKFAMSSPSLSFGRIESSCVRSYTSFASPLVGQSCHTAHGIPTAYAIQIPSVSHTCPFFARLPRA